MERKDMVQCQRDPNTRPRSICNSFVVATRYYRANKYDSMVDTTVLKTFSRQLENACIDWYLAIDASDTLLATAVQQWHQEWNQSADSKQPCSRNCTIVPILDWGHIVTPLNKILALAMNARYKYVIYQSLEIIIASPIVLYQELIQLADEKTLVVGFGFTDYHQSVGEKDQHKVQKLTGLTCPWNTLALWSTDKLFRTGFLATLPEGNTKDRLQEFPIGVEEASVIAIQQAAWPVSSQAKLVFFESNPSLQVRWYTHDAPHRRIHQAQKMASKVSRTKAHLDYLALSPVVELIKK